MSKKKIGKILPENYTLLQDVRYGENKHQEAAFYGIIPKLNIPCIANYVQRQGKKLSFNNILDADAAIETVKEFEKPACVIIKHNTPCGIATSSNTEKAWQNAFATDVYSPFGGVVAFNREVTISTLEKINEAKEKHGTWLEVLIAPSYGPKAQKELIKKKNLRVLSIPGLNKSCHRNGFEFRSVTGGCLVQEKDTWFNEMKNWKIVTEEKPSEEDLNSMSFAVKCIKHVRSNAVLFVKGTRTVAIGGGQTSRIDAVWIAIHKGKGNIKGSIMASDAFFPFRDSIDVAAEKKVKAIIQPGGSIRDEETIQAANEHGIIMVFSGQRYFKH